ncbi:MAG TPA: serine hydrolase [Chitinophagaceae bacterium]|nr:serine hydrolase [Chitinophagaceae bacterium]
MKKILNVIFLIAALSSNAQKTDQHLQNDILNIIEGFHGNVGVYVYDIKKNRIAAISADTIYPTASIVKIPILIGVMHKIYNDELQYHQVMTYTDSLFYSEGEDILASFKNGEKISVSKLLMLMMSTSDNAASLWLQGLSGSGTLINTYLDSLGLKYTRVNSRTPERKNDWEQFGWGQTTPREMGTLMKMIIDKKIINTEVSEKMLRLMGRQYWDEEALSQIPPGVFVADKNGAVDQSRNEIMFVNGAHPYILSIFTKNNQDQSWEANNEAWVLTRKVSAFLWKHFNSKSNWKTGETMK